VSDSTIDKSVLVELQEAMGFDFTQELVATFLDEAPGMLADLKSSAEVNEQDAFRRAAHSIKSNANIFGAHGLAELARKMEISGLDPETNENEAQITALNAEYESAAIALRGLMDG
jgi:histidine phosphotransfer protein HptB